MVETGDNSGGDEDHSGRRIAEGTTKVLGRGRGSRRKGTKLRTVDGKQEPGYVQVEK